MLKFAEDRLGHLELGIFLPQLTQVGEDQGALLGVKGFGVAGSSLRGEKAEPDFVDLLPRCPEIKELVEIAGAAGDLRGEGAVDRDASVLDVGEDAFVGSGFSANVVFGLEAIDGDDHVEFAPTLPVFGDDAESAGNDLRMDVAAIEFREELLKLAVANEGIAADEGEVERPVLVDDGEYAGDKLIATEVSEIAQAGGSPEVGIVEGVAARAAQGAFAGDFY